MSATDRLIEYLKQKQGYEVFTSMLWVDVFTKVFPPNNNDSWLYGPEFAYSDDTGSGRCDLVLAQSLSTWPMPFKGVGLPFLAAEFKAAGAGEDEWKLALVQLDHATRYLARWWSHGQPIFGVRALGNFCAFYEFKNGNLAPVHKADVLNMADANDRKLIYTILEEIRKVSPAKTAKFAKPKL